MLPALASDEAIFAGGATEELQKRLGFGRDDSRGFAAVVLDQLILPSVELDSTPSRRGSEQP